MSFLVALIIACIFAVGLRNPIKKVPWLFYILAIIFDALLLAHSSLSLPLPGKLALMYAMMRGNAGVAMFIVVMFIGVLPRDGKLSKWLRPIRAELSIIACLLIAGHMLMFLSSYIPRFLGGSVTQTNVNLALVVAILLLILILVLGITSARFVKKHMRARNWKKLQSAAYLFYALIFIHLMCMLGPSAIHGNNPALVSVVIYCIIFIGYAVLRIARAMADKREKVDLAATVMEQGFEEE